MMSEQWEPLAREYCRSYDELFQIDDSKDLIVPNEKFPEIFSWYSQYRLVISTLVGVSLDELHYEEDWPLCKKNAKVLQLNVVAMIARNHLGKLFE